MNKIIMLMFMFILAVYSVSAAVKDNVELALNLDDTSGDLLDSSGNGFDFTNDGGDYSALAKNSSFNTAIRFIIGNTDKATKTDETEFDCGTGDFGVSYFINITSAPNADQVIVGQSDGTDGFLHHYKNDGDLNFYLPTAPSGFMTHTVTGTYLGTYHQFTILRIGTTMCIVQDNNASHTCATTGNSNIDTTADWTICARDAPGGFDRDCDAVIDEVVFWCGRAPGMEEITAHFNYGAALEAVAVAPTITFVNQTPVDLNSFNILGVNEPLNITYDITDTDGVNASTVLLFRKLNSTEEDGLIITNGTVTNRGWETTTGTNISDRWTFLLTDKEVYPATYNYPEETMIATAHSSISLDSDSEYIKIELLNITNSKEFNFVELMANTTGIFSGRIYYCNSTYSTGNPDTSTSCTNFFNIPAAKPYNHSHSVNSYHHIIPFAFDNVTKLLGGVYVNNGVGYFLLRGRPGANSWNAFYIAPQSRLNAIQTTVNGGTAWSNFVGTVDSHLHQFSKNTSLYYKVYACDTLNNCDNSTTRQDLIDIGNLPPTAPDVFSPVAGLQSGNISINYTAAVSPNQFLILRYNVSLLDSSLNLVTNISDNNTALGFIWDSTAIADGVYIVEVAAFDSQSLSSSGFSDNFTVKNVPIINFTAPSPDDVLNVALIWINLTVSSPGAASFNCTLNNTLWGLFGNTSDTFSFNSTSPPEGSYTVLANCTDNLNRTGDSTISFVIDLSAPTITQTTPNAANTSQLQNTGSITPSTKVDDNNDLYLLEINITQNGTNKFTYGNYSLSGRTTFTFQQVVNTTTWDNNTNYTYGVRVCDSSTAIEIPSLQSIVKYNNLTFGYEDTIFTIAPLGSVIDSSIEKLKDRYTFQFEYIGKSLYKEFIITAKEIVYLPNSKKKGHFIIENKLWVDFIDADESKVNVEKIDNNTYKVSVYSSKDILIFQSVGFLNCLEKHYQFELIEVPPTAPGAMYGVGLIEFTEWFNFDVLDTSTVAGVLLYFFLFIILVSFYIVSEVSRIPAIVIFTGFLTIIFGYLIYATLSAFFGFAIFLLGMMYIFRGGLLAK